MRAAMGDCSCGVILQGGFIPPGRRIGAIVQRRASNASLACLSILPCARRAGAAAFNTLYSNCLPAKRLGRSHPPDRLLLISDPIFYLAAFVAVIFLGLAKGGFAGVGLVATPLLALVVPPVQAAAIVLPILIVQDIISLWVYRRDWDGWNVKVMTLGAFFGVGGAWVLAAHVSDAQVRLAVGLIAIAFVLSYWLLPEPKKERGRPSLWAGIFWGGVSGFTSALSHAGGPPFQIYALPQRMAKLRFVGTATVFFACVNWMKLVPFFALGQFSPANLKTSLALFPLAIATNFLGVWLVRITPMHTFYRIAYSLVFVIGLALIESGLSSMLFPA